MDKAKKKTKPTLRASGAGTWANCPGSVQFKGGQFPYDDNDAADFGSVVHKVAAMRLHDEIRDTDIYSFKHLLTNREWLLMHDRLDDFFFHLNFYLNAIERYSIIPESPGAHQNVYRWVEFSAMRPLDTYTATGTCDYGEVVTDADTIHINIIDLKTGFVPVNVNDNLQLFVYAHLLLFTAMERYNLDLSKFDVRLTGVIVQPAHNDIKFADIPFDPERFGNLYTGTDELNCGSWCGYCKAATVCPEIRKRFSEYYKPEFQDRVENRITSIAELYPMMPVIGKIADTVQKEAMKIVKSGGKLDGFELRTKNGRRVFNRSLTPDDVARKLKLKKSDVGEFQLHSPAQLEKKINDKTKLDELVFRPKNEFLARSDDPFDVVDG